MKKRNIGMIAIVMLVIVAAMSVPASAWWYNGGLPLSDSPYCNANPEDGCTVWENIVIANGSYDIDLISSPDIIPEDYTYDFTVPDYDNLMYAGLYQDVWSSGSCGPMQFTYNGNYFGELHFGTSGAGCGHNPCDNNDNVAGNGLGGNGVFWDVTDDTNPGQINSYYKNDVSYGGCSFDGRDRGCSLITWGQNYAIDDTLHLWFNQGQEDDPVPDTHIFNVPSSLADEWTLCVCIDTADNGDTVTFNGHTFVWSAPNHWMDVNCYDVSSYMSPTGTNTIEWYSTDEYFHPYWTLLVGRKLGAVQEPDLVVEDIEFPEMMRPSTNYQVTATVLNQGDASTGTAFDVSLVVDGGAPDIVTGVGPLGPGASTPVDFTVNLAEGCHEFIVTADCNNAVGESIETNNYRVEDYQVGNVIVVRSNTDLANLDLATYIGDTYYIQGHSITNCAGVGITIENTTDKIVITDCTVYDCLTDGVQLYNVTNVAIEDSTIRDNSGKGIRVKKSTYVDITGNDILRNGGFGIETYPRTLGPPQYLCDCEYINIANNNADDNYYGIELIGCNSSVKNNTVSDSTQYGMYVHGNYNSICHNDIQSNHDYGMKVYNATENCILWNEFVTNNIDYPARTSQAWDNSVSSNYWNTAIETCHHYIPNPPCHQNRQGNYWSNYGGMDLDNNGIGDTSYPISGGAMVDGYPLIATLQNYVHICCGDMNCLYGVDPGDVVSIRNYLRAAVPLDCYWAGNVDGSSTTPPPYPYIDTLDYILLKNRLRAGVALNCWRGCPDCVDCYYCTGCR